MEERQEDLGRPKALAALVAQTQGDLELRHLPQLPVVLEVARGDLEARFRRREDSEMPPLRRHRGSAHLVDSEAQPPPPLEASVVRLPPLPVDLAVSAQLLLRRLLGALVLLVGSAAQPLLLPLVALAVLLPPGASAVLLPPGASAVAVVVAVSG